MLCSGSSRGGVQREKVLQKPLAAGAPWPPSGRLRYGVLPLAALKSPASSKARQLPHPHAAA